MVLIPRTPRAMISEQIVVGPLRRKPRLLAGPLFWLLFSVVALSLAWEADEPPSVTSIYLDNAATTYPADSLDVRALQCE